MKEIRKLKVVAVCIMLFLTTTTMSQSYIDQQVEKTISKGFVLLRQDYQILNEDDEAYNNQPGTDFFGRTYTCGIRLDSNDYLVERSFVKPWLNDTSVPKGNKYHQIVSFSAYREMDSKEPEQMDVDVEIARDVVENHLFTVSGSELSGFEMDREYGKKIGLAVWLVSATQYNANIPPTELSLVITPLSIATKEEQKIYDIASQPTGNIIGGAFIIPKIERVGQISFKVNGMFEKLGGVWKLISLGNEQSIE